MVLSLYPDSDSLSGTLSRVSLVLVSARHSGRPVPGPPPPGPARGGPARKRKEAEAHGGGAAAQPGLDAHVSTRYETRL